MKALQRTLAVLACLYLVVQTVRHAYVLWLEPRASVLDRFDHPLKDEIAAASSVEELVRRYEPIRKEADRLRAEQRAADPKDPYVDKTSLEPFKSETALREAITSWEQRAKELHALRFYWTVGLLLAVTGSVVYLRANRWAGTTLLIIAFSEIIYWTAPNLFGGGVQEFQHLVANKLVLSVASLVLLGLFIRLLGVFDEGDRKGA